MEFLCGRNSILKNAICAFMFTYNMIMHLYDIVFTINTDFLSDFICANKIVSYSYSYYVYFVFM